MDAAAASLRQQALPIAGTVSAAALGVVYQVTVRGHPT